MEIRSHSQEVEDKNPQEAVTKKIIIALFLILLSLAIFDKAVKYTNEFSVNLSVLYNGSWMLFAAIIAYIGYSATRKKWEKWLLIILAMPFLLRAGLNLIAINTRYNLYSKIVNNNYVDLFTWLFLVVALIIFLCSR